MSRTRETLAGLALLALIFSGPAAVGAYLLSGDDASDATTLAALGETPSEPSKAATGGGAARTGNAVLAGVLYTAGTALVDWNGVRIPVENGSYAYLGGEVVSTGPGDLAVLRLDSENSVYLCPSSRMSLARGDDGAYRIRIAEGGGRFAFAPGTDYRIEANRGVLTPSTDGQGDGHPAVVEIAAFRRHPGGVICGFSGHQDVAGYSARDGADPIVLGRVGAGDIVDLSRALRDETASSGSPVIVQPIPMPPDVGSWLERNAAHPESRGFIGYLCRCLELKRYAEADGIPDTAIRPRMFPPEGEALVALASDSAPRALPPQLSAAVLAEPGAPNPADSAVLASATGPLTVPPPLVPVSGTGGGVSSTPF